MDSFEEYFRNPAEARKLAGVLREYRGNSITIMEVCGSHTMAIFRYGIRDILPEKIRLVSGPGCPVCVTPSGYIETALELSKRKDVVITTFGDLMRVPSGNSSGSAEYSNKAKNLIDRKADGADVRIVYSPLDAVKMAENEPRKEFVFLSVGFETTNPVCALAVGHAAEKSLENFTMLTANKTIPTVLETLANDRDLNIQGFMYPGHVSAIMGNSFYRKMAANHGIPGVVTGFEPLDILHAVISLADMINRGDVDVLNEYSRIVSEEGNPTARHKTDEVFESADSEWRGIGIIKDSGLKIKNAYSKYDARVKFQLEDKPSKDSPGCICGEIIKGKSEPIQCPLFGKACTPENPAGACMVSSEGTCAAHYKYKK